jgi:hypothetical protein
MTRGVPQPHSRAVRCGARCGGSTRGEFSLSSQDPRAKGGGEGYRVRASVRQASITQSITGT